MTRKLQEQNHTKIETKLAQILRCFRKNKTIPSGSVVQEVIHRAKMVLSAYELVCCYFGNAQDKLPGTRRRLLGKKQLGGKRISEVRGAQVVTAQISWGGSLGATVGLGEVTGTPQTGWGKRECLENRNVLRCCLCPAGSASSQGLQSCPLC